MYTILLFNDDYEKKKKESKRTPSKQMAKRENRMRICNDFHFLLVVCVAISFFFFLCACELQYHDI